MQALQLIPSVYVSTAHLPHEFEDLVPVRDPLAAADGFHSQGATWVQVLDLDHDLGSRVGVELVSRMSASGNSVLASGGIFSSQIAARVLDAGASHVVISPSSWAEWGDKTVARFGEQLILGFDVLGEHAVVREDGDPHEPVDQLASRLDDMGVTRVIVRCLASDRRLTGPNYELLGRMCARTHAKVIASGGISSLEDLRRLRGLAPIGVEGAVVGRALSSGVFTYAQARDVTEGVVPLGPSVEGGR